ncbi:class I poly(R)-hydroxyalkanoic acid synthase [Cochlodiniinecator piscidefendens]|uniref:class I poly(R)-hydroxyalkanoic acid synthase n=1 Tax=Cochlodiniinecator piscidefendens TaxID=2715756 RepID=UPI00140B5D40|nr:class I poly(R)-hydroxyalkanoic acid synthase [Cochlodiniinecator piscidefendens]
MTTDHHDAVQELPDLAENLAKVEELSQRIMSAVAKKPPVNPALEGPGQDLISKTTSAYLAELMENPTRIFENQLKYWTKSVQHFADAQEAMQQGGYAVPADSSPTDKRFSNPLWETNPYFNFVKQQYQINAEAVQDTVAGLGSIEGKDRQRLEFFAKQIVDLLSPTNFLGTNPDALEKAVETQGQSLIDGLQNLVRDLENGDGDLLVSLADQDAFEVGKNIATCEGSVVFRNRMFELIQFKPTTETVHKTPLILFPPWINKYYVLDLKPQNSLIRWIVDQGYTLFVVSWVNPDESYADVGMDNYIEEGYLTAIDTVKAITNEPQVNAVGYCIAGTTLSVVLGLLAKRGDKSVKSATFFTTMTDFSDQGEFGVFLENDFVDGIEAQIERDGLLKSYFMSRTFSYLRSNDLVYGPAIRSYMMGEAPPAFDLLFWNGDSTNLPGRMAREYLRGLCQGNALANEGFEVFGETMRLSDVKIPVCSIACETDHIAAWKSCFSGFAQFGSKSKKFILSESGHIAGIVNPPSKKKYGHFLNEASVKDADEWKSGASFHNGSWWGEWESWLSKRSGKQVESRKTGGENHPELCAAPGTYVL